VTPRRSRFNVPVVAGSVIATGFTAGVCWRLSPAYNPKFLHDASEWLHHIQGHPWTLPVITLMYMAAGLILFAHAVLLWATVLTFDPWHAALYCEVGSLASGAFMYGVGRILRPSVVRRLAGSYLAKVSEALGRRGVLTIIILHWFPICPYNVLNLLAGSTHIRFRDFLIGTAVGITPGILFISFFGDRVRAAIFHPQWQSILAAAGFLVVGGLTLRFTHRLIQKTSKNKAAS
jgi:phospholipase D1/2